VGTTGGFFMRSIAFALVLIAGAAFGQQTTYTYLGQPMQGSNPAYVISGYVTLSSPLAANGTQIVTPLSYSFVGNLPVSTANGQLGVAGPYTFSFTTSNGSITAWDIQIPLTAGTTDSVQIGIQQSGDSYLIDYDIPSCASVPANCQAPLNAYNSSPGTWMAPAAAPAVACAAPPAAPTPPPVTAQPVTPAPVTAPAVSVPVHFRPMRDLR
jgi:hypothetical protein